jgi:hypothetical protein
MPRIVAGKSRQSTFDRFRTAVQVDDPDDLPLLLVDSEGPIAIGHNPWQHLNSRKDDPMPKPLNATNDECHLMVQLMESWFLADPQAVKRYFGTGVLMKHLKEVADIELVAKADVMTRLNSATKTSKHGKFDKARDSFELLSRIDPARVEIASRHAKRLLDFLRANCI